MKDLKLTPIKIRLEFQQFSEGNERPSNERLNEKEIILSSLSDIPSINDYISFLNEADGSKGHFKVKSRNFSYKSDSNLWFIFANVVLEEVSLDEFSTSIKE